MEPNPSKQFDDNPFFALTKTDEKTTCRGSNDGPTVLQEKATHPVDELSSDAPKILDMIEKPPCAVESNNPNSIQTVIADLQQLGKTPTSQVNNDEDNRLLTVQERKEKLLKLTKMANNSFKPSKGDESKVAYVTDNLVKKWTQADPSGQIKLSSGAGNALNVPSLNRINDESTTVSPRKNRENTEKSDSKIDMEAESSLCPLKNSQDFIDQGNSKNKPNREDPEKHLGEPRKWMLQSNKEDLMIKETETTLRLVRLTLDGQDDLKVMMNHKSEETSTINGNNTVSQSGSTLLNGNHQEKLDESMTGRMQNGIKAQPQSVGQNLNGHNMEKNKPSNGLSSVSSSDGEKLDEATENHPRSQAEVVWKDDKAETVNNVSSKNKKDVDVEIQKCSAKSTARISSQNQKKNTENSNPKNSDEKSSEISSDVNDNSLRENEAMINGETTKQSSSTSTRDIMSDALKIIQAYEFEGGSSSGCSTSEDAEQQIKTAISSGIWDLELNRSLENAASKKGKNSTEEFMVENSSLSIDIDKFSLMDRKIAAKLNNLYFDSTSSEDEQAPSENIKVIKASDKHSSEDVKATLIERHECMDDSEGELQIDIENFESDGQDENESQDNQKDDGYVPQIPEEIPEQVIEVKTEQNHENGVKDLPRTSNGDSEQDAEVSPEPNGQNEEDDCLEGGEVDPTLYDFSESEKKTIANLLSDVEIFSRAAVAILRAEKTPVIPNIKFRIPTLPAFEPEVPESIRAVLAAHGHIDTRLPTQQAGPSSAQPVTIEYEYIPFSGNSEPDDAMPSTSTSDPSSHLRSARTRPFHLLEDAGIQDTPDSTAEDRLAQELLNRSPADPIPPEAQEAMMQVLYTFAEINAMKALNNPQHNEAMPEEPYSEKVPDLEDEPMDTEILPKDRRKGIIYPGEDQNPPAQNPPIPDPNADPEGESPPDPQPSQEEQPNPANPPPQNPGVNGTAHSAQAVIGSCNFGGPRLDISEQSDMSKHLRQSGSNGKDQGTNRGAPIPETVKPLPFGTENDEPNSIAQKQPKSSPNDGDIIFDTAPVPVRISPIPPIDERIPDDAIVPEEPENPPPEENQRNAPPRARGSLMSNQENGFINTAADHDSPERQPLNPLPEGDIPDVVAIIPENPEDRPPQVEDVNIPPRAQGATTSMELSIISQQDTAVNPFVQDDAQNIGRQLAETRQKIAEQPGVSPNFKENINEQSERSSCTNDMEDSNDTIAKKAFCSTRRRTRSLNQPTSPKFKPYYHPGTNNEYASELYQNESPQKKSRKEINKPRETLINKSNLVDQDQQMDINMPFEERLDEATMQVLDIPTPAHPPPEIVISEIPSESGDQEDNVVSVPSYSESGKRSELDQPVRKHDSSCILRGENVVGIISCTNTSGPEGTTGSGERTNPNSNEKQEAQEEPTVPPGNSNLEPTSGNNEQSGIKNQGGSGSDDDGDKNTQKRSRKKSTEPPIGSPEVDKEKKEDDKKQQEEDDKKQQEEDDKERAKYSIINPPGVIRGSIRVRSESHDSTDMEGKNASSKTDQLLNQSNSSDSSSENYMKPIQKCPGEAIPNSEQNKEQDEGVQSGSGSQLTKSSTKRKGAPTPEIDGGPNKMLAREDGSGQKIPEPSEAEAVVQPSPNVEEVGELKPARIRQRRRPVPSESDISDLERGQSVFSESGISGIEDSPEEDASGDTQEEYANARRLTRSQAAQIEAYQQLQRLHPVDQKTPPAPVDEQEKPDGSEKPIDNNTNPNDRAEAPPAIPRLPPSLRDLNLPGVDADYDLEVVYYRRVVGRDQSIEILEVVDPPESVNTDKRKRSSPAEEAENKKIKTEKSDEDVPMGEINAEEPVSECDREVETIMSTQNQRRSFDHPKKILVLMSHDGTLQTRVIIQPLKQNESDSVRPIFDPFYLEENTSVTPKPESTTSSRRSVPSQDTCSNSRRSSLRPPRPGGAGPSLKADTGNSRRESFGNPKQVRPGPKQDIIKPQPKSAETKTATATLGTRPKPVASQPKTAPKPTVKNNAPDPKKPGVKSREPTTKREEDQSSSKKNTTTRPKSKSPRKSTSFRR